jgi:hypothetical protein
MPLQDPINSEIPYKISIPAETGAIHPSPAGATAKRPLYSAAIPPYWRILRLLWPARPLGGQSAFIGV